MDGQELAENPNTHTLTRFKATQALYKKSIKPIREKKRRTRINASLDELKGLLQGLEGQKASKVSKLEKADILELAVQHLQRPKRSGTSDPIKEFSAGYSHCQNRVSSFFRSPDVLDLKLQSQLFQNLRFQTYAIQQSTQPGKVGKLKAAPPAIWNGQALFSSPYQREAAYGSTDMKCNQFPSEQCILPFHLWLDPLHFQTPLAPEGFSASMSAPSITYNTRTDDVPPAFVIPGALTASVDCQSEHAYFIKREPHISSATHQTLPTSAACESDCSSWFQMELPVTQGLRSSPCFDTTPQVWRPW